MCGPSWLTAPSVRRKRVVTSSRQGGLCHWPLPTRKWEHVAIDFVMGMPEDQGMNVIMTVVDKATKMCHFIPCSESITAKGTAQLYWQNVGKLHGIPAVIISNRDSRFTSRFWCMSYGVYWAPIFGWGPGSILNHQVRWNASTSCWGKRCDVLYTNTAKLGAGRRCYLWWNLQSTTRRTGQPDIPRSS